MTDWDEEDPWAAPVIRWNVHSEATCKCGHADTAHRLDVQNTVCQTVPCGCQTYRYDHHLQRGHTTRRVYIPEVPVDGPGSTA